MGSSAVGSVVSLMVCCGSSADLLSLILTASTSSAALINNSGHTHCNGSKPSASWIGGNLSALLEFMLSVNSEVKQMEVVWRIILLNTLV